MSYAWRTRLVAMVLLFALVAAGLCFAQQNRKPFTLLVTMGHKDQKPTAWDGQVSIDQGQITRVEGYKFKFGDAVLSTVAWKASSHTFPLRRAEQGKMSNVEPVGVQIYGLAGPAARVTVTTKQGEFSVDLAALKLGEIREELGGAVQVRALPRSVLLTDEWTEDDFPDIAADPNGGAWAVWVAFNGTRDDVRLCRFTEGQWKAFTYVPGASGDVWKPQVEVDAQGLVWVVWGMQVNGNWDIYARALEGDRWHDLVRITTDPLPDINHFLARDKKGNLWLVWQGFRGDNSDIFLARLSGQKWGEPVRISEDPADDWDPSVAVDSAGRAHVVWDSYANGNFDVFLRSYDNGKLSPVVPVAATPRFEAHASVACDGQDRVWVAWDIGEPNWGKDQGHTIRANQPGVNLYRSRMLGIRCYINGQAKEPVADIHTCLPESERHHCQLPFLFCDSEGRLWVMFRHKGSARIGKAPRIRIRHFWEEYLTYYQGDRWAPAILLPSCWGRNGEFPRASAGPDGRVWVAWQTDRREYSNPHKPVHNDVYAGFIEPVGPFVEPKLQDPTPPEPIVVKPGHPHEAQDVAAIRAYRTIIGGREHRIVRGDLHRHQELSWDSGGGLDGSMFNHYRYMLDAAAMDFGATTDHNGGGDYPYWWWYTQKLADLFHVPGRYVPLYGYERSVSYPNGHRNVFYARRGYPVISFFTKSTMRPPRPGIGCGDVLENDTKLLYEYLRKFGAICISHTSATNMGTDWRDNDPEVEPVVEIFQGCRKSYEHKGAPRAASPDDAPGGYREAGFVWNAWAKGYRLGIIASSDHGSTHISYAMVYTDDFSRKGIIEAIRKRHTYGATDNIILEVRIGEHFMGDEFTTNQRPRLKIHIRGTAEIAKVDVIKNNTYVYTVDPQGSTVDLEYEDLKAEPGVSYYYVRVQQEDGQIAWGSPMWVHYQG